MTFPTEAQIETWFTTNWVVGSKPTLMSADDFTGANSFDSFIFHEKGGDIIPVSAGIDKTTKIFEYRLSHSLKRLWDTWKAQWDTYVATLTTQKPVLVTKEYLGPVGGEYVWTGTITFTEWS